MPRRPVNLRFSRTLRYKCRLSVGRRCLGEGHVEKCAGFWRVRAFRAGFGPIFCTLRRSVRSRALRNYDLDMDALATVCSWETNGIMIWAWMLWPPYALGKRTEFMIWNGCSGHRMLLGNERNYDLGMDALATVCSWETNGIMIWAWMLWPPYALGKRTEL